MRGEFRMLAWRVVRVRTTLTRTRCSMLLRLHRCCTIGSRSAWSCARSVDALAGKSRARATFFGTSRSARAIDRLPARVLMHFTCHICHQPPYPYLTFSALLLQPPPSARPARAGTTASRMGVHVGVASIRRIPKFLSKGTGKGTDRGRSKTAATNNGFVDAQTARRDERLGSGELCSYFDIV